MSKHITETQLEGFVLKTLTDAEREHIVRHTANCPTCRATLQGHEVQLRRIQYELQTELRQARPSPQMNFDAIATDIPRLRRFTMFQQTSTRVLTGALALVMLVVGFMALNNFWRQSVAVTPTVPDVPDVAVAVDDVQTPTQLDDGFSIPGWHTSQVQFNYPEMTAVSSDYEVGIDTAVSYQGGRSGTIRSKIDEPAESGNLNQTVRADAYRGQRIQVAAFLKTDQVDGYAIINVTLVDGDGRTINSGNTRNGLLTGTQEWQRREIVVDVPENSAYLSFGASLTGSGQVWVDNWTIEIVSADVPVTADRSAPNNLGLELATLNNTPQYWFMSGSNSEKYQVSLDDNVFTEGQTSALLQPSSAAGNDEFSTLMQAILPGAFRGQRVRLTADVKSEQANQVMPWMRVDGPHGQALQIHNNADQFLSGTVDWTPYEIVLDVPEESTGIYFGLIVGGGKGWIDNVQLEVVGQDVPTTNSQEAPLYFEVPLRTALQPEGSARISTPLSGWFEAGTQPEAYEMGVDTAVSNPNNDLPTVYIRGNDATATGSGTLVQTISAQNYRGQRISLMMYLQSEAVNGQATPWLRVDSLLNNVIAKAEVGNLALSGSQGWTAYELVLDVPDEALIIAFGVSLKGAGTVWVGDVQLEEVSNDVPTTNQFDAAAPVNLNFEE